LYWNAELIDADQLQARIAVAAARSPQPELHLRAERTTHYERVAQVMAAAQSGGLGKIGFVTDPKAR
jgi:biopolymer transport protein ExbD